MNADARWSNGGWTALSRVSECEPSDPMKSQGRGPKDKARRQGDKAKSETRMAKGEKREANGERRERDNRRDAKNAKVLRAASGWRKAVSVRL